MRVDIVLKKARVELDKAYYAIAELLNALVLVEGAEDYEGFIKKLNPIISKYAIAQAAHAGKIHGKKGKKSTTGDIT
jgi:protein-arginine kinase activator protein McsA